MTGKERLFTALRHGKPDRPPVVLRGVAAWDDAWVASRHPSYRPVIEAVQAAADWEAYWPVGSFLHTATSVPVATTLEDEEDWVVHLSRLELPGGSLTRRVKASKRGLPGLQVEHSVKSLADVELVLTVPYTPLAPDFAALRRLQAAVGDRGLVLASLDDPIAYVHDLLGSELLALWSLDHPEVIDRLVAEFTRRVADTLALLLARSACEVYGFTGTEYLTPPLASPAQFRRWVVEPERLFGEMIHEAGALFWVHCHGPMRAALPGFLEMGVDCLHPVEAPPMGDVTLVEARAAVGDRLCLEGNVQIGDLYAADEARVRRLVRQAIDEAGRDGSFVLCPTASPHTAVLSDRTVANYLAFVDEGTK